MSMFMKKFFGMCVISAALCGGCSEPGLNGDGDVDTTANLQQKGGGWTPNGPDLMHGLIVKTLVQGIRLSRLDASTYLMGEDGSNYRPVTSITYNGFQVSPMDLGTNQGFFRFTYDNGKLAEKKEAAGLTFNFSVSLTGTKVVTPVSLFVKDVSDPANGLSAYGLHAMYYSYTDSRGEVVTQSLCKNSNGDDEPVVPVAGHYWNNFNGAMSSEELTISFACQTAAVAGCIEYGYHPWQSLQECNDVSDPKNCHAANMWNVLQTCTRLKRADYCGSGTPHTMSGTEIWPADWLQPTVTNDARVMLPTLEALWNQSGISCVIPENLRHKELLDQDPNCYDQIYGNAALMIPAKPRCYWERPGTDVLSDAVLDPK